MPRQLYTRTKLVKSRSWFQLLDGTISYVKCKIQRLKSEFITFHFYKTCLFSAFYNPFAQKWVGFWFRKQIYIVQVYHKSQGTELNRDFPFPFLLEHKSAATTSPPGTRNRSISSFLLGKSLKRDGFQVFTFHFYKTRLILIFRYPFLKSMSYHSRQPSESMN